MTGPDELREAMRKWEKTGEVPDLDSFADAWEAQQKAMRALIEWAKSADMSIEREWGSCRNLDETGEWAKEILDGIVALAGEKP